MSEQIIQLLIGGIIAIVTGGVGAYLGSKFTHNQMKKEKSFTHRLEWYQRMIQTINQMTSKSILTVGLDPSEHKSKKSMELVELTYRFKELLSEAPLYITRRSAIVLRETVEQLDKLAPLFASTEIDATHDIPMAVKAEIDCMKLLENLKDSLCADVREQMGMETVEHS